MKRIKTILVYSLVIGLLLVLSNSCSKDDTNSVAVLTTTNATEIAQTTATSGGNITNDGGATVNVRGVCFGTKETPTINDSQTTDGSGDGIFTSNIANLTPNTTYYARAYATNSKGTSYGNTISFTTLKALEIPTLITDEVFQVRPGSASAGGSNINDGGSEITARGLCWSKDEKPTINNGITTEGTGTANFYSTIKGLRSNTIYYVRAYATNSVGTGYGNILKITSLHYNVIDVDGNSYKVVVIGTQVWMAENLKTTKYKDSSPIPLVTGIGAWSKLTTPSYCWYAYNEAKYKDTYGALYNWYAGNTKKLCPAGWHMPSYAEWTVLFDDLGGKNGAGNKLKESGNAHWKELNKFATNEVGFTALPGGVMGTDDHSRYVGIHGYWWSSTEDNSEYAPYIGMTFDHSKIIKYSVFKKTGYSVRCVKD